MPRDRLVEVGTVWHRLPAGGDAGWVCVHRQHDLVRLNSCSEQYSGRERRQRGSWRFSQTKSPTGG